MERRKDNKGRVLQTGESQRKDGLYVYQYKDIFGKRKSVYSNNLSDLRKQKKKINLDLEYNISNLGSEITLNEQFDKYMLLKSQLRNSTRQGYLSLWNWNLRDSELGNKKLCDIKKSDILRFYNSLVERGLKCSTIRAFNYMISPCLDLAVDDDIIRKNPCNGCLDKFSNDSKKKVSLTVQEQEIFLDFIKNNKIYCIYYPMMIFMIGTAVRCGEAVGLTWDDLDFKNREISINHQLLYRKTGKSYSLYAWDPKTDAGNRVIPMTNDVYRALLEQRKEQALRGYRTSVEIDGYKDFVFSTKHRNPMSPSSVNNFLKNIVNRYNKTAHKEISLPHISAHTLRHTGCTRMAEAGIDPKVLQYIMGHSNIAVTMEIYNHISPDRYRTEMQKMEKIRMIS